MRDRFVITAAAGLLLLTIGAVTVALVSLSSIIPTIGSAGTTPSSGRSSHGVHVTRSSGVMAERCRHVPDDNTVGNATKGTAPTQPTDDFQSVLLGVPVWPDESDATIEDWRSMIEVACWIQHTDPSIVERTITEYLTGQFAQSALSRRNLDHAGQVFLVLRVAFELPRVERSKCLKFWAVNGWPDDATDEFGLIDLSWPIRWDGEIPTLIGRIKESSSEYEGAFEYRYFLQNYPFRRLKCEH